MKTKYTKELLELAVKKSQSVFGVLRELGVKPTGGTHSHIKKLIRFYGIDSSHFTGQGWAKNLPSNKKLNADEILVKGRNKERREKAYTLRRALKEKGIEEKCSECNLGIIWNSKEIILEVDHIDGESTNNAIENLRFLCPNCHSQTENYGKQKHPC